MRAKSEKGDKRQILEMRRHLSYGRPRFLEYSTAKEQQQ
jgi:hypothetical protein